MDYEDRTLQYYGLNAGEFAEGTRLADMTDARLRFSVYLPPKGIILDFGCGSGRDTKAFLDAGFRVDAVDGSAELCELASEYTGIQVRRMLFSELDACKRYDGIWACASVLHLPREELAAVTGKMETALKHGGVLYASFKYGTHEGMRNGRWFTDFTEETLEAFWKSASSMPVLDMWVSGDVRSDRKGEKWINLLARRI